MPIPSIPDVPRIRFNRGAPCTDRHAACFQRFSQRLLLVVGPGCSRKFFRERADCDVEGVITQKNRFPAWAVKNWHVYPDPRARFADPFNPDRPPYPPDDYAARVTVAQPTAPTQEIRCRARGWRGLPALARTVGLGESRTGTGSRRAARLLDDANHRRSEIRSLHRFQFRRPLGRQRLAHDTTGRRVGLGETETRPSDGRPCIDWPANHGGSRPDYSHRQRGQAWRVSRPGCSDSTANAAGCVARVAANGTPRTETDRTEADRSETAATASSRPQADRPQSTARPRPRNTLRFR